MIYTSSAGKVINTGAGLKVISNRFKVFGNGATITAGISVSDAGLNVMTGDFAVSGSSSLGDKLTADGKLTAHAGCRVTDTGLTVASSGAKVTSGGVRNSGGVDIGGSDSYRANVAVTSKLVVSSGGIEADSGGIILTDNSGNAAYTGLSTAGGMTLQDTGLQVKGEIHCKSGTVKIPNLMSNLQSLEVVRSLLALVITLKI